MDARKIYSAMCLTIVLMFFLVNRVHANTVYSITSNPVFLEEAVKVTTITRGAAANSSVYKVATQTVSKALMLSTLRKTLALTPYGVAALAAWQAYGYFMNEDGELVYTPTSTDYSGDCYHNTLNAGSMTMADCTQYIISDSGGYYPENTISWHESATNEFRAKYVGNGWYWLNFYLKNAVEITPDPEVVADEDLYQNIQDYITDNPTIDHTQLFYGEDGQVNQDYFPDPEFNLYTPEDQVLIDLYGSGLLQSSDPSADNYVTPDEYARIADLHAEQNKTAEEQADDLTTDAELPMTRIEYAEEQALKEQRMSESIKDLSGLEGAADEYSSQMDEYWDGMTDLLNSTNDLPTNSFVDYFSFTSSTTCSTIELPFGMGVFPNSSQCEKLGTFKDYFGYFLFVVIAWNMIMTLLKEAN